MERWFKKKGYVKEETNQVNSAKICKPSPCPNRNLVIFPSGLQKFSRNLFTIFMSQKIYFDGFQSFTHKENDSLHIWLLLPDIT